LGNREIRTADKEAPCVEICHGTISVRMKKTMALAGIHRCLRRRSRISRYEKRKNANPHRLLKGESFDTKRENMKKKARIPQPMTVQQTHHGLSVARDMAVHHHQTHACII
jgi:hypothetical protein